MDLIDLNPEPIAASSTPAYDPNEPTSKIQQSTPVHWSGFNEDLASPPTEAFAAKYGDIPPTYQVNQPQIESSATNPQVMTPQPKQQDSLPFMPPGHFLGHYTIMLSLVLTKKKQL